MLKFSTLKDNKGWVDIASALKSPYYKIKGMSNVPAEDLGQIKRSTALVTNSN